MPAATTQVVGGPVDWSVGRDQDGHRNYTLKHLVRVTKGGSPERWPGPAMVLQTVGIPQTGNTWNYDNDVDVWAFCLPTKKVDRYQPKEGEPVRFYVVESSFSTRPFRRCNFNEIGDPLLEPPKIKVSSSSFSEEADFDRFGNPILNSAHEQLRGQQVEFDANRFNVTITQNVADPNYPQLVGMLNTLNQYTIWGFPRRCVKLTHFDISREYKDQCTPYYARTLEFDAWCENDGTRQAVNGIGIFAAGSGYVVGDTLTVTGGAGSMPATAIVTAVGTGGDVAAIFLTDGGSYSALPTSPNTTSTSGTGGGAGLYLLMGPALVSRWDKDLNDEGTRALNGEWDRTTGTWKLLTVPGLGVPPDPLNPAHFCRFTDRLGNPFRGPLDGAGKPFDPDHPSTLYIDRDGSIGDGQEPPGADSSGLSAPTGGAATPALGGSMSNFFMNNATYKVTTLSTTGESLPTTTLTPAATSADSPNHAIRISWNTVTNAKGYRVYRNVATVDPVFMFKLIAQVGAGRPGVIHVEKYGESDFTLLNLPLYL